MGDRLNSDTLRGKLARLSGQCLACAAACAACADASLASGLMDTFRQCLAAVSDCQEICQTTAHVAERYDGRANTLINLVRACAKASATAAAACEAHAEETYAMCAAACRACERACADALTALRWR